MLCYSALLWQDMVKTARLKKGMKLPRLFPIVIYNGRNPWLKAMNVASLLEDGPDSTLPLQALQAYRLLDIGRVAEKDISGRPGLVSQLVRLEQAKSANDACSAVHELNVQLRAPRRLELRRSFTAWLDRVLCRRKGIDSKKLALEINDLEDIETMLEENAANWKQEYIARLDAQARAEAYAEGRAEGRAEVKADEVINFRDLLASLVEDRLGVVPDDVARLIAADCGVETYSQLIRSVYKVKDLQELLGIMMATLPGKKLGS